MADDRESLIRLQLDLSSDQPELLAGLDAWLALGLISDAQVRRLSQDHLTCAVVLPAAAASSTPPITDFLPPDTSRPRSPRPQLRLPPRSSAPSSAPFTAPTPAPAAAESTPAPPSPVNRWTRRLMSELSVVWLLGLGVFLVVLSSAVLAATQWVRFNAIGQYLVLLAYTLLFWGAGLWCGRNSQLQLTAKTLQMITLLLLPLNFWAMDGLGVWSAGGGWLIGTMAAGLLTWVALQVFRQRQSPGHDQINLLGLAYLQSGWGLSWMSIAAVYGGALGSAAITIYGQRQRSQSGRWSQLTVIFALGLLLVRALAITNANQLGQFSLAFGLYGATWVYLGQRQLALDSSSTSADLATEANLQTMARTSDRWAIAIGRGLLLGGWLLAIGATNYPQAFAISLLGLGLRLQALGQWGKRRDLLVAYSIAVQLAFVGWQLVPYAIRQGWLRSLATLFNITGSHEVLLGLSLFPYVILAVAVADRYLRRGQPTLGRFSDGMALGTNALLTLISLANGPVLVINLIASTITALVATLRRSPLALGRILTTYGLGLLTVIVALDQRWPRLPLERWMMVMVALAVLALGLSRALPRLWGKGAWWYGLGLSALAYTLLGAHLIERGWQSDLSWLGLVIPVVFTLLGHYPLSLLATGLALPLTLGLPWTRLGGLVAATGLTGVNSVYYRQRRIPALTLGMALGAVISFVADWLPGFPRHGADWSLVMVGLIAALWLAWRMLSRVGPAGSLADDYRRASDHWGHGLTLGWLWAMTIVVGGTYGGWRSPLPMVVLSLGAWLLVLGGRYGGQIRPVAVYLAGWGIQLLLAEGLAWHHTTAVALAVPTLGLGASALLLSIQLQRRRPDLGLACERLTLGYGGLALLLRLYTSTPWTGWLVVVASLLLLDLGRRRPQPLWRWLALGGLSVGWFELVLYPMLRAPGGAAADGLIVLAGVAALIMAVYRVSARRLALLGLPPLELIWAAHMHWLVASLLLLAAGVLTGFGGVSLGWLAVAIATLLMLYALAQGRLTPAVGLQQAWVYAGLAELVGWFTLVRLIFPPLAVLDPWWGVVACGVAVPLYWLPWANQGWPQKPWRVMAVGTPLAIAGLTGGLGHIPTLWVLVGFYGWVAWHSHRLRVSYLSVVCAVGAIWLWLDSRGIDDSLAQVLPLGLALLYVAQVEPTLQTAQGRSSRHWLRVLATALILLTALFSSGWGGLSVGVMGLGAIGAGLWLRIRAFLYTGTLVFTLNALHQLILLNATYPLIKWIVGILVGIALIWIAADFERRRDQWLQLTQTWSQDLDQWQ